MNEPTVYVEKLTNYLFFPIGIMIFATLVVLILFFVCIREKYTKMALVTIVGGSLILLLLYFGSVLPYQKDVEEQAFETYTGEFYVEKCYTVSRGGTYVLIRYGDNHNSVRYKVLCDVNSLKDDTTYLGTFVCSDNSKCLLDIDLQNELPKE